MLDHPQNCFCNGNRTCNVSKDCTKAIPQGTTTFLSKNLPQMRGFERKLKNGKRCANIFYQAVIILSIRLISGCRITASIPAFQAGDGGSTPLSRSNGMNLTRQPAIGMYNAMGVALVWVTNLNTRMRPECGAGTREFSCLDAAALFNYTDKVVA